MSPVLFIPLPSPSSSSGGPLLAGHMLQHPRHRSSIAANLCLPLLHPHTPTHATVSNLSPPPSPSPAAAALPPGFHLLALNRAPPSMCSPSHCMLARLPSQELTLLLHSPQLFRLCVSFIFSFVFPLPFSPFLSYIPLSLSLSPSLPPSLPSSLQALLHSSLSPSHKPPVSSPLAGSASTPPHLINSHRPSSLLFPLTLPAAMRPAVEPSQLGAPSPSPSLSLERAPCLPACSPLLSDVDDEALQLLEVREVNGSRTDCSPGA